MSLFFRFVSIVFPNHSLACVARGVIAVDTAVWGKEVLLNASTHHFSMNALDDVLIHSLPHSSALKNMVAQSKPLNLRLHCPLGRETRGL